MSDAGTAIASVVIPAHQEESVISRCLTKLLSGAQPGELEVVVVANGCTDRTASIVRSFAPLVRLIEVAEASKATALNAGDRVVETYPRLYLDADVELTVGGARALASVLQAEEPLIAFPQRELQQAAASPAVRLYLRTWEALQRARGEGIGAGVYAVNRAGRERFGDFPPVIADDLYVFNLFQRRERRAADCTVKVWPPATMSELISVLARVAVGGMTTPSGPGAKDRPPLVDQARHLVVRERRALLGAPLYVAVTLLARQRAKTRLKSMDLTWSRATRGGA